MASGTTNDKVGTLPHGAYGTAAPPVLSIDDGGAISRPTHVKGSAAGVLAFQLLNAMFHSSFLQLKKGK